jgi:hypothetical protein
VCRFCQCADNWPDRERCRKCGTQWQYKGVGGDGSARAPDEALEGRVGDGEKGKGVAKGTVTPRGGKAKGKGTKGTKGDDGGRERSQSQRRALAHLDKASLRYINTAALPGLSTACTKAAEVPKGFFYHALDSSQIRL